MSSSPSGSIALRIPFARLFEYVELAKPRLSSLVLATTAAGYWLGSSEIGQPGRLLAAMLGTALAAAGANALNEWMEHSYDALMLRTRQRPIPSGRIAQAQACAFGWALALSGLLLLALAVNGLSALLALASLASYVFIYTPLKRKTALCTLAGAIPGAIPPMIGWAAARGSLGIEAWGLFWLLFIWQLPHFLAIALLYREDYAKAGFKMLPVTEGGSMTARQTVLYGLALVPLSLFPSIIGLTGRFYFYAALLLSVFFLAAAIHASLTRATQSIRRLFLSSIVYLPLLLVVLVCDKAPYGLNRFLGPQAIAETLPDYGPVPDFSLTSQQGKPFSRHSLAGSVWIVDFIFTRCSGQCPLMTQTMAGLSQKLAALPDIRFASISVDPEYDTPKQLQDYARTMHADSARWVFATGSQEAVYRLSREGFHLGVGEEQPAGMPTHSIRFGLIDRHSRLRGLYPADDAEAMQRLLRDARRLSGKQA